ncbi:exosortase Q [Rhizobacter sp. LjRoot28]|uniref:exosortase Q n=1 Tax=Rhizobacter sp. LjRoot28 TaxID=3342309 RepID=UPI003ED13AD2
MLMDTTPPCGVSAPVATSVAGRWLGRFDRLPPVAWVGMLAAALWPHWQWAAARLGDGSDDPLGVVALAALLALVARESPRMQARGEPCWLAAAAVATVAATASTWWLPPLAGAVLAALAVALGARAFLPPGHAVLPLAGLAVLALPVLSSLQFYAGHPLRVVTAELSTHLLRLGGLVVERSGTAMWVEGRLVIVDAPCSGVQMVWMAYFAAFCVAAWHRLPDRAVLGRLPALGGCVLAGNVVRNGVLVGLESHGLAASEALHQGIGLMVLAGVCAAVVAVMRRPS